MDTSVEPRERSWICIVSGNVSFLGLDKTHTEAYLHKECPSEWALEKAALSDLVGELPEGLCNVYEPHIHNHLEALQLQQPETLSFFQLLCGIVQNVSIDHCQVNLVEKNSLPPFHCSMCISIIKNKLISVVNATHWLVIVLYCTRLLHHLCSLYSKTCATTLLCEGIIIKSGKDGQFSLIPPSKTEHGVVTNALTVSFPFGQLVGLKLRG